MSETYGSDNLRVECLHDLSLANVFIKKFQDKDLHFSPVSYLDNDETYLKRTQEWKKDSENEYLRKYPHFGRNDWPVRHKKIYRHQNNYFFLR